MLDEPSCKKNKKLYGHTIYPKYNETQSNLAERVSLFGFYIQADQKKVTLLQRYYIFLILLQQVQRKSETNSKSQDDFFDQYS